MKKIIFYLLLTPITFFFQQASGQEGVLKTMTKLGSLSGDSENEGSEKDPVFKGPPKEKPKYLVKTTTGTLTKLIDLPEAQQIVNRIADALTKKEINISILSQHKYMINSCLGIKASVGEFKIKLARPVAKLETGGMFLQFTIDKVIINGLSVRMRPCAKDLQCHFGSRFTVGGSASDVRLEIRLNPLVDLQNCQVFGGPFSPRIKWRIGGLNLKPLQNNLDEVAKNLIEDALTAGALFYMPNQIIDASISAIFEENLCLALPEENNNNQNDNSGNQDNDSDISEPRLNDIEQRIQQLERRVTAIENGSTANGMNKSNAANSSTSPETSAEKWAISPSGLKGAAGIVSVNLPAGVEWNLVIKTSEDKALGRWDDKWDNKKAINLVPGEYNIFFTYIPLTGVPIQKGMNTRLKAGILDVVTTGQWSIHDENKTKAHVVYYKPSKIGLPIGKYNIQINGQYQQVEIKDGEVTEF